MSDPTDINPPLERRTSQDDRLKSIEARVDDNTEAINKLLGYADSMKPIMDASEDIAAVCRVAGRVAKFITWLGGLAGALWGIMHFWKDTGPHS